MMCSQSSRANVHKNDGMVHPANSFFRAIIIALAAAVMICAEQAISCDMNGSQPVYSTMAVTVHQIGSINSPDNNKRLVVRIRQDPDQVDGWDTQLIVKVGEREYEQHLAGWRAEVAWSPDSKAFFVTENEGGFGFSTYVYYFDGEMLRKLEVAATLAQKYQPLHTCASGLVSNVAAVGWLEESRRLLVVAEDYPIAAECQNPGTFQAYVLTFPDNVVVRTYSQSETTRQFWNLLGCELRKPNDNRTR